MPEPQLRQDAGCPALALVLTKIGKSERDLDIE